MEFGDTILRGESVTKQTTINVENMTATVTFATAIPKKQVPPIYMRAVLDFSETGMSEVLSLAADSVIITTQQAYRTGKLSLAEVKDCRVDVKATPKRAPKEPARVARDNLAKMAKEERRAWLEEQLAVIEANS